MSTQRGNVKRTRPQKHQNKFAFRNDLHDSNKRNQGILNLEISGVCLQCKSVIEWKIKYKKYKPLSQPKTCLQCHTRSIKFAYHTLCDPCGKKLNVCCKCREKKDIMPRRVQMKPKNDILAMMKKELKLLPERKRRTFYRYLDSLYESNKASHLAQGNEDSEDEEAPKKEKIVITEDYIEMIRKKIEDLSAGLSLADDDFDFSDGGEDKAHGSTVDDGSDNEGESSDNNDEEGNVDDVT